MKGTNKLLNNTAINVENSIDWLFLSLDFFLKNFTSFHTTIFIKAFATKIIKPPKIFNISE